MLIIELELDGGIIMDFKIELIRVINEMGISEVLKKLGYLSPTVRQVERLKSLLNSTCLNLDSSNFDFKYGNSEYIKKLTEISGLNIDCAEAYIRETLDCLYAGRTAFKPYIFIETGFKRASQPIFILASLESKRYLTLPDDFNEKQPHEQLDTVYHMIDKHMEENKGLVSIWGNVKAYYFVYDKGRAMEITPSGKIRKMHDDYEPSSKATIAINGKEFSFS